MKQQTKTDVATNRNFPNSKTPFKAVNVAFSQSHIPFSLEYLHSL